MTDLRLSGFMRKFRRINAHATNIANTTNAMIVLNNMVCRDVVVISHLFHEALRYQPELRYLETAHEIKNINYFLVLHF